MFLGLFYSFLAALFFSVAGMLVKIIYANYTIGENLLFLSILFFSFLYYILILVIKNKNPLNELKIDKRNFLLATINGGLIFLILPNIFSLASLKYIDIGVQRAITFSSPVFIIIIQKLFFNKKIDLFESGSIFLIIIGLFMVIGKVNISLDNTIFKGLFFAFLSTIAFSIYSIISENKKYTIADTVFWIYSYGTAMIIMFIITSLNGEIKGINIFNNYKVVLSLFILSLIYAVLPYYFFNAAIKKIGAAKANMGLTLTPIISLILGIIFLNNTVSITQIFGFSLVILSLIAVSLQHKVKLYKQIIKTKNFFKK